MVSQNCCSNFLVAKIKEDITTEKENKLAGLEEVIRELEAEVNDYVHFKENKQTFVQERNDWKARRDKQRLKHEQRLEEIEHDKIVQIDKLRKDMLLQIRAVKVKMLNMNEDQLVGTTKLTVIQNASLTGELEYQSK